MALHESPRSSISLLPLLTRLSDRFTVIAIDTPGYGFSDPLLHAAPEMSDYVATIAALLAKLGLPKVGLYGTHTGAAIAAAFAVAHPDQVSALVLDGYGIFTESEKENFITRYLTPFAPSWDGSHIMHLWSRIKDLYMWFPWYDRSAERRLMLDPPDLLTQQLTAIGFLQTGSGYELAYRRAAEHDANGHLQKLQVPVTVVAREDDLLHSHLSRVEPGSHAVLRSLPAETGAWLAAIADALAPALALSSSRACFDDDILARRHLTRVGEGYLHWRDCGDRGAPVLIVLPDLPQCSAALMDKLSPLCDGARVLVIDLPGCGQSDPLASAGDDPDAVLAPVAALLNQIGVIPAAICGIGASAGLASRLGELCGAEVFAVAAPSWVRGITDPPHENPLPSLEPDRDGARMMAAWFRLRDLWFYEKLSCDASSSARIDRVAPAEQDLHARYRAYFLGPECRDIMAAAMRLACEGYKLRDHIPTLDIAAIAARIRGRP
ncbi:alpha/beta fold hydrolase [Govanella unica]|uniref:Alpha/beta hydrolase n=1 Tax=Govanella unica TaxID=2975056 RepID=A0A9X3TZ79_9PROT|nr:alpha/beta hydrolase [Govania unica]MDA5194427.1 alpha/beta hydrolase [Govania unica]